MAKAITSAYAPMGAMVASDRVAEPFMEGDASFAHGFTFAGHPVAAAIAMANLDVFEREDLCGHVLAKEGEFREMLESLRDLPIVGDVRGAGYFQAIELVKDKETKESFDDEESEDLLRGFLSGELYRRGLICRADDRGDPVDPAGAAADRRHRAVRRDPRRPARRARRGRPSASGDRSECSPSRACSTNSASTWLAGASAAESPVRWVHISELEDPTPWLSGGELMLTTGIPFDSAAKQRAFVRRLADHNLAGLGFGTGFNHSTLPKALVDEASKRDFPLFEVPYSTPVHRDHREGLRAARQRAVRGPAAGHRGPAPARAAGPRRARPRGDRRDDRLRGRRHGRDPRRPRRAARRPRLPPRALRRGGRRRSARKPSPTPATATPSSPPTPRSPAGRSPTR